MPFSVVNKGGFYCKGKEVFSFTVCLPDNLPMFIRLFPALGFWRYRDTPRALRRFLWKLLHHLCHIDRIISNHEAELQARRARKAAADNARREKYANSPLLDVAYAFTGDFVKDRSDLEALPATVGAVLKSGVICFST